MRVERRSNDATPCCAMAAAGFDCIAHIDVTGRTSDVAIRLSPVKMAVIRFTDMPYPRDHSDLATMIAEGTFAFAALLYEDREGSVIEGPIAAYHVSEIDHLVARLVREAGA